MNIVERVLFYIILTLCEIYIGYSMATASRKIQKQWFMKVKCMYNTYFTYSGSDKSVASYSFTYNDILVIVDIKYYEDDGQIFKFYINKNYAFSINMIHDNLTFEDVYYVKFNEEFNRSQIVNIFKAAYCISKKEYKLSKNSKYNPKSGSTIYGETDITQTHKVTGAKNK